MPEKKKKKINNLNLANALTFFRIALVPLYVWLFAQQKFLTVTIALVVFIGAAITDLYDGKLARKRAEITKLGKFMDPLADKFLVLGALAQFWVLGLVDFWLVIVIIVRDLWVTGMRITALVKGTELKTSKDGKLKTTIQLTVIITIITFTGARHLLIDYGYLGPLVNITFHKLFYNMLLAVAVVFTLYSWVKYTLGRKTA